MRYIFSQIKRNGLYVAICISYCLLNNIQAIQLKTGQTSSEVPLGHRIESTGNVPTEYDAEILLWSNKIRQDPKSFIPDLEKMIKDYKGNDRFVVRAGHSFHQQTREGVKPLEELISFLKVQKPLPPLKLDSKLKDFACQHAKDQGPTGKVGHDGLKGDNWIHRIHALLQPGMVHGENIAYGKETAKEAIIELAIDDGVSKRGHRKNLFKKNFNKVGICQGDHKEWNKMVVVMYSGDAAKDEKEDQNDNDQETAIDIKGAQDINKENQDKMKQHAETKQKAKKQTEEELLKKPYVPPKQQTNETKEQIKALKHQIKELKKGQKIERDNGISNLDDQLYKDDKKLTPNQERAKKFVNEVLEKDKQWRKEVEAKKAAIEKKKQEKAKQDAELVKAEKEAKIRLKEIDLEKQGFDPKITTNVDDVKHKMNPDIQHVIKDFSKDTKIIMPKDMKANSEQMKATGDPVFAKKEQEKEIPSKHIIGKEAEAKHAAELAKDNKKQQTENKPAVQSKEQKPALDLSKLVPPAQSTQPQLQKIAVDHKKQEASTPVSPKQQVIKQLAPNTQAKQPNKDALKSVVPIPDSIQKSQAPSSPPKASTPSVTKTPAPAVDLKKEAPKSVPKFANPKVEKTAPSPALDKFMNKIKNADPSKPTVETHNREDAIKESKEQEQADKKNLEKKGQIKNMKDALEGKGDPKKAFEAIMKPKSEEKKEEKKEDDVKKVDDKLEHEVHDEEEGEESTNDIKFQKKKESKDKKDEDKTDEEKKQEKKKDLKKQEMGDSIHNIVKSFNTEKVKEEQKHEEAKEKKKVVIKDVLGSMKTSINTYKEQKEKINKGVDQSGHKYQDERAKAGLGDIEKTIKNYEHLKDQTVQALKAEGKVLQHEQDMKAKAVLHTITPIVDEKAKSHTQHDFEKDRKENEFKDKPELTHQEKEDAIIEATKNAPKIGFSKIFEAAKDVHQSTLPKKALLKDIVGSIKDGIDQKDHVMSEEVRNKDIAEHQNKVAHDYEDIKPEEMDSNNEDSIESLLKKTSKLKALEIAMKDKEKEYDEFKAKQETESKEKDDKTSHAQGPVTKSTHDIPEEKDEKKDEKSEDKSDEKKSEEPNFKSFYDPTWTPKDETQDEWEKQAPGSVNESQIEMDDRNPLDFHYDSQGQNKIERSDEPPQTATEMAQANGDEFNSDDFTNWISNKATQLVNKK